MTEFLIAALTKAAERPSTLWRIAWLAFCFLVLCLFGVRTLRKVVPCVLAGVTEAPTPPTVATETDQDAGRADRLLPVLCWLALCFLVAALLLH